MNKDSSVQRVIRVLQYLQWNLTDIRIKVDNVKEIGPSLDGTLERRIHHHAAINVRLASDILRGKEAGYCRRGQDRVESDILSEVFVLKHLHFARGPVGRDDSKCFW